MQYMTVLWGFPCYFLFGWKNYVLWVATKEELRTGVSGQIRYPLGSPPTRSGQVPCVYESHLAKPSLQRACLGVNDPPCLLDGVMKPI